MGYILLIGQKSFFDQTKISRDPLPWLR